MDKYLCELKCIWFKIICIGEEIVNNELNIGKGKWPTQYLGRKYCITFK